MSLTEQRISYLLEAYTSRKATLAEERELFEWVAAGNEQVVKEHILKLLAGYDDKEALPSVEWDQLYQRIQQDTNIPVTQPVVRKISWIRWAAAAVIPLFVVAGYHFLKNDKKPMGVVQTHQVRINDIAPPKSSNAVLTLGNGRKIILDSTGNGTLAIQGAVNVVKLADGQIAYKGTSGRVEYNTLTNPRGSKVIALTLGDGSKVWLNAESSLTYPTIFAGNERKVEMTGEAYFEVAHNASMPFIVSKGPTRVQVLGTHFNVNAYNDESLLKVTLLEGSVSVRSSGRSKPTVIRPGEQAQVDGSGNTYLGNAVDLDQVMAWKNGMFSYKGVDIETIMRQVSRWYDVTVVFEKPVHEKFYAEVSRNTDVSTLLKILGTTQAVHFQIDKKIIHVKAGLP